MNYLPDCLASLEALEESFAVCVVDNGSTDGSVEWLQAYEQKQKPVQTVFLPENTGFCGAVNTGNFCPNCGGRRPAPAAWTCTCGAVNTGKFCPNCGKPRP